MDILRKGNKDLIKDINRYTVLNLIREKGEITRTEIAKKCDFGMSTLTYILDDLQQEGIILEGAETSSTGGRRAKLVRFNKDYGFVVSVKVEEEKTSFCVDRFKCRNHGKYFYTIFLREKTRRSD